VSIYADIKEVKTTNSSGLAKKKKRKMNQVILLPDTRLHTSLYKREAIATVEWTVLPYPPYSPDLAPFDFQVSGPLKDEHRGHHFVDDKLNYGVREEV
jgi:histone-lysine N-methyltransferase SETMAR